MVQVAGRISSRSRLGPRRKERKGKEENGGNGKKMMERMWM